MAQRILGLMGPGEGPMVFTRDLGEEPLAKITGLTEGGLVEVECEEETFQLRENGLFKIRQSSHVRVRSSGSPFVICTLHSGRKRAVS